MSKLVVLLYVIFITAKSFAYDQAVYTEYFQCTEKSTGNVYNIVQRDDPAVDYISYDLKAVNPGYYGYNLVHLDDGPYYETYEEEDEEIFELYEKERQGTIGLGPDGVTLPAWANEISKFTLNKKTGKAVLLSKSTYMLITTRKEKTYFENCIDLR